MLNRILDQLAALTSADRVRGEERERRERHPAVKVKEVNGTSIPRSEINVLGRVIGLRDKLGL